MAKKAVAKKTVSKNNPTLHGLFISRSLSGSVVRVLTFAVLVFAVSLVGTVGASGYSGGSAFLTWLSLTGTYLVFDIVYVLMTKIRPLHPRLDRAVLPLSLIFSLAVIFIPLMIVDAGINIVNLWITGGVVLFCILGTRLGLLIASSK